MALSVTPTDEMKTLTVGNKIYEIVDDQAREDVSEAKTDLLQKANIDGAYSDLTAGNAEQLVSTVYEEDSVPYIFRTAGGSMDIGDREEDMLVGGSIAWNQLVKNPTEGGSFSYQYSGSITYDGDTVINTATSANKIDVKTASGCYVPFLNGHKYFFACRVKCSVSVAIKMYFKYALKTTTESLVADTWTDCATIGSSSVSETTFPDVVTNVSVAVGDKLYVKDMMVIDLTQAFGSTIADYIYNLETATPGAGVAWFKKLFPKDYYAYNAGSMLHVEGLSSHNMVGFNQWDEVAEVGGINESNGNNTTGVNDIIRSKNYIAVVPNTSYYCSYGNANKVYECFFYDADKGYLGYAITNNGLVTTPANCAFMRFRCRNAYGTTYNHDICINLHWDGERDGEYEPYVKHSYPLDSSLTLRGIPKLDSANNLYYDGDTYESDGTVTRRYKELLIDRGKAWYKDGDANGYSRYYFEDDSIKRYLSYKNLIINNKGYESATGYNFSNVNSDVAISLYNASSGTNANKNWFYVGLKSSLGINTLDAFKTWLDSNNFSVVYELATPTTETAEPYQNPQIVDDFGTEEYVTTSIVPVGHVTKYQPNLRAKLEMAPDSPDGDGDYIVRQANGENSYVSLASTATIQDILARLTALEGGTT